MKIAVNLAVSLVALGALLGGTASQATNIAELPLKAAVLAKPNLVYGIDDSGSMDWEILIGSSSGVMWWDGSTAWDAASGKPRFGGSGDRYTYLFPVGWIIAANPAGDAPGGGIYGSGETWYKVVPPTPQFAWLRSAAFNPQYYDPTITYKPWAPGYFDGSVKSFSDSPPAAAKIHPTEPGAPTLNLTQEWNSTNAGAKWTADGYRFFVDPGMKVPVGSRLNASSATSGACYGGTAQTLTVELTTAAGKECFASIPYYPATYWHAENCVVDGSACVLAPNGTTKLKRYEIKAGNTFPSGRNHAAELQNFANWFTYYRKRKLSLAGSMGEVLENLTGVRMGTMRFAQAAQATPPAITMFDADATAASSNRLRTLGDFYRLTPDQAATPTHKTMQVIGDQFNTNTGIVQYACQRNAMFVVTDGFANAPSGVTVPAYSQATYGAAAPYTTTPAGSLADLALAYYTRQLRASGGSALVAGKVPVSGSSAPNADHNPNLHVNTYAISLGVSGSIWPSATDPFVTAPTWPVPVPDTPTMLDDLWHATLNGRGLMFLANNPTSTVAGIRAAINDILNQTGAQGGIAVSTVNLQRGDSRAYFGTYNPAGWVGDLTANAISAVTGDVNATPVWSTGAKLLARAWGTRVIASHNGAAGVGFTAASVGALVNPGSVWGDSGEVIDYLRGDRTHEGTKFRTRTGLIGAVINAEPVVARDEGVVYFASGEGMLHAVDTRDDPGKELWAYVPRAVLPDIGQTTGRGYAFKTQLDGSPVIGKTGAGSKLLVAGMGAAGRSYYAIDVSSPRTLSEGQLAAAVKWEFPSAGDATTQSKVGQTLGRPAVVRLPSGNFAVLLTSGYNNTHDGKGRLWMLDPASGAILHEFTVADGTLAAESGLAHISPFVEADGSVRFVFGGDLRGNVWKFDLVDKPAPARIAVLKDASGNLQPVTAAPELLAYGGKRIVLVGTGRLLDIGDFGSTAPQTFYAVADGAELLNARASLVQQTYNKGADTITSVSVDWTTGRGWYVDLPLGEHANTRPSVSRGAVTFVTNVAGSTDCTASSYLYVLKVLDGSKYPGATFVGTQISATANSSGVNLLLTSDGQPPACTGANCPPPPPPGGTPCQHIVGSGQTTDGASWKRQITQCVTITPAKNAWREIRR
ncbi:MAG: pyrrolo-quinoline quinone [Rubrivivax sp.]|nr:pyrrolo-quinoline quinone [Rubrivivax sp.]